ncbi:hypothetical protein [Mycolicibacterium anyangense]|uniref:hypothetical protein n=1 Tax=Mycolicibacterium anyangense TaxID=1431246 RepID=UPI0013D331A4|nr:hypothetical protein [Mycolicibacterium anyangense]
MAAASRDDDNRRRDLAFEAIPSAWPGLSRSSREDVIDLLSTYDHVLALKCLVDSTSLDSTIADAIRAELGQQT